MGANHPSDTPPTDSPLQHLQQHQAQQRLLQAAQQNSRFEITYASDDRVRKGYPMRSGQSLPLPPEPLKSPPYSPPSPRPPIRHLPAASSYTYSSVTPQKESCPYPDSGRSFADLPTHIQTHISERPEESAEQTTEPVSLERKPPAVADKESDVDEQKPAAFSSVEASAADVDNAPDDLKDFDSESSIQDEDIPDFWKNGDIDTGVSYHQTDPRRSLLPESIREEETSDAEKIFQNRKAYITTEDIPLERQSPAAIDKDSVVDEQKPMEFGSGEASAAGTDNAPDDLEGFDFESFRYGHQFESEQGRDSRSNTLPPHRCAYGGSPLPDYMIEELEARLKSVETSQVRKTQKRTKTGCVTCRRLRIKCGEERPTCQNCIKSKRNCEGYAQRVVFKQPLGAPFKTEEADLLEFSDVEQDFVPGSSPGLMASQEREPKGSTAGDELDEEMRRVGEGDEIGEEEREGKSVVDELMALWIVSEPSAVVPDRRDHIDVSHKEVVPCVP